MEIMSEPVLNLDNDEDLCTAARTVGAWLYDQGETQGCYVIGIIANRLDSLRHPQPAVPVGDFRQLEVAADECDKLKCGECDGSGIVLVERDDRCGYCGGSGMVAGMDPNTGDMADYPEPCPRCGGYGVIQGDPRELCGDCQRRDMISGVVREHLAALQSTPARKCPTCGGRTALCRWPGKSFNNCGKCDVPLNERDCPVCPDCTTGYVRIIPCAAPKEAETDGR
jgi:hypothetical protein